eukprot:g16445.t2
MTSCSSQDNFCESIQRFASRGLMRDETTRFSYGSTEIFHFQGCSAFSEYTVVHAQSLVKIRKDLHQPPLFLQCFMLKLSGLSQDAPLEVACLLGGGVAAALGMVWRVAALPYGCPVGAVFGLQAEGLAALRALQMAKAGRRAEAPADVAFDTLGYEATLQQALAPWAPSYALVSSASSAVHVTGGLAGRGIPFGGWRPKLHVPLLGLLVHTVMRDEVQRSQGTDVPQVRARKKEQKACAFGSSAERGLASLTLLTRPRSGEEVKPEETSEQRDGRRRSSSSSGDGRQCVTPMAAEHSEASEKIKARIHKQWKGEAVVQSRKSLRGDSRSPNVGAKEGLVTSSRSTSAGVSPQRDQSNRSTGPPAAFAPPVTRAQREIIQLDHQYGATLRKVKSIYDSHLDGITELRRENDRLRAALAPGAWSQLRPSPSVAGPLAVPVGAPLGVAQQFPLNGAGRPQAVPRLNLQGLYPAN